jgi:hypothetical protein
MDFKQPFELLHQQLFQEGRGLDDMDCKPLYIFSLRPVHIVRTLAMHACIKDHLIENICVGSCCVL